MEEFKSERLAVITSSQGKGMAEILPRKIYHTFKIVSGWLGQRLPQWDGRSTPGQEKVAWPDSEGAELFA